MRIGNPKKLIEGVFENSKLLQNLGFNNLDRKPKIVRDNQYICVNKNGELIGKLKAESLQQAKVGFACRFKYGAIRKVPLHTFDKPKKQKSKGL